MKTTNQVKYTFLLSALLASTLAVSPAVLAETQTGKLQDLPSKTGSKVIGEAQTQANKDAIKAHKKSQHDLLHDIDKGISEGFKHVAKATQFIAEDKDKQALKELEAATGKFDIALAANPDLGLVPIDAGVKVTELITTPAAVKAQIEVAQKFLKDSKVQAARAILQPLRDDIETREVSLPMTTYPAAIKLATRMLVEGQKKAALSTLATALTTLVEKRAIIPLSLIRVQSMVKAASELDKEKGKDRALLLLDAAEEQLQLAVALGYADKHSVLYKDLSEQIKALKKEARGGNVVERLYSKLNDSIKQLVEKSSEQSEQKGTQKAENDTEKK